MSNSLVKINYPFDLNYLKNLYMCLKNKEVIYTDTRYGPIDGWKIIKIENDEYINQAKKSLGIINAKPRFYTLSPGTMLPEHVDNNTQCSINILLVDNDDVAPVNIEGVDYFYSACLLNTQKVHSVKNNTKERILFKLSIFDLTFDETKFLIKKYIAE